MTEKLSKKLAQYEYKIINNQISEHKVDEEDVLPLSSKENSDNITKNRMYSSWEIDHKIEIINDRIRQKISNSHEFPQHKPNLIWIGYKNKNIEYAILHLLLENFKPGKKLISEDQLMVLKDLLYNSAEYYLNSRQKQIFVENLCLLQYHNSTMSEFFTKHKIFLQICVKLIQALCSHSTEDVIKFEHFAQGFNKFIDSDARQALSYLTQVIKSEQIYQEISQQIEEKDYIIQVSIFDTKNVYIINEKGCIFIYDTKIPYKKSQKKQINSPRRKYLQQRASPINQIGKDLFHKTSQQFKISTSLKKKVFQQQQENLQAISLQNRSKYSNISLTKTPLKSKMINRTNPSKMIHKQDNFEEQSLDSVECSLKLWKSPYSSLKQDQLVEHKLNPERQMRNHGSGIILKKKKNRKVEAGRHHNPQEKFSQKIQNNFEDEYQNIQSKSLKNKKNIFKRYASPHSPIKNKLPSEIQ